MEGVLHEYHLPYDKKRPVLCFDERPCQLLKDVVQPLETCPGMVKKEDYKYDRNGTCVILLAVDPLTGKRIVEVSKRKTREDYARFINKVSKAYKDAEKIVLIQDNLNTHHPSSFYKKFSPKKAFDLMRHFNMVYTPKKASWLNMAEIEFSALSKQCLDRRIGSLSEMEKEVSAWTKLRNKRKIKINWQFTKIDARKKMTRHYNNIRNNKS